jgi:hypothetical protein
MILIIFSPENCLFSQTTAIFGKKFDKNAYFSPKIVIILSIPGNCISLQEIIFSINVFRYVVCL